MGHGDDDDAEPAATGKYFVSHVNIHLDEVRRALDLIDRAAVLRLYFSILTARDNRRMVFVAGNGGSAAIASHFVCDLQKVCGVRAIALTDNVPLITAWANDADYSRVFREQLYALAKPDDVMIAISCSGTSPNIKGAHQPDDDMLHLYAIFGEHGREAARVYDGAVVIPAHDYGVIEDCASAICHALVKQVAAG